MTSTANAVTAWALGTAVVLGLIAAGLGEVLYRSSLRTVRSAYHRVMAQLDAYAQEREKRRAKLRCDFARVHGITLSEDATFDDLVKALADKGIISGPLTHNRD